MAIGLNLSELLMDFDAEEIDKQTLTLTHLGDCVYYKTELGERVCQLDGTEHRLMFIEWRGNWKWFVLKVNSVMEVVFTRDAVAVTDTGLSAIPYAQGWL